MYRSCDIARARVPEFTSQLCRSSHGRSPDVYHGHVSSSRSHACVPLLTLSTPLAPCGTSWHPVDDAQFIFGNKFRPRRRACARATSREPRYSPSSRKLAHNPTLSRHVAIADNRFAPQTSRSPLIKPRDSYDPFSNPSPINDRLASTCAHVVLLARDEQRAYRRRTDGHREYKRESSSSLAILYHRPRQRRIVLASRETFPRRLEMGEGTPHSSLHKYRVQKPENRLWITDIRIERTFNSETGFHGLHFLPPPSPKLLLRFSRYFQVPTAAFRHLARCEAKRKVLVTIRNP